MENFASLKSWARCLCMIRKVGTPVANILPTLIRVETKQYKQVLLKLVSASYLKPSTILSHLSPRDKCIQYEAEEKRKIIGFPTAKELREAKEVAQARLKREEEEAEQVGLVRTQSKSDS